MLARTANVQAAVPATVEQAQSSTAGAGQQPDEDLGDVAAALKDVLLDEHCQCMLALSLIWTRVLMCFQVSGCQNSM